MNALDSPLEALAFNYLSFGFLAILNNLWAWIAVATAAISIWRIKATANPLSHSTRRSSTVSENPKPPPNTSTTANNNNLRLLLASPNPIPSISTNPQRPASVQILSRNRQLVDDELEGLVKGRKLGLYYNFEENVLREVKNESEECIRERGEVVAYGGREDWWGRALEMKRGDMEWYRFQDVARLNGSIVKLWNGEGMERRRCR